MLTQKTNVAYQILIVFGVPFIYTNLAGWQKQSNKFVGFMGVLLP